MKIVIDVPRDFCEKMRNQNGMSITEAEVVIKSFYEGTPLPKGHGRLIDADAFISYIEDVSKRHKYENLRVDGIITVDDVLKAVIESLQNEGLADGDAPTIIEAESEEY